MWKGGARGMRVSPEPFGDPESQGPDDNNQPDSGIQLQQQPQEVVVHPGNQQPAREPDVVPSQRIQEPVGEPEIRQRKHEHLNGVRSDGQRENIDAKNEKTKDDFSYKRQVKRHRSTSAALHRLINQAATSHQESHNNWTNYLWERKRDLVMAGPVSSSKNFKYFMKNKWNSFKISWNEFLYSVEIWRLSMKKIEGHQGTGVVSYFVFLRWMFLLNIFIFIILFWLIAFIQAAFDLGGYGKSVTGVTDPATFAGYSNAISCQSQYTVNVSSDTLTVILDFFQGTGWMEKTALFYGFYTNEVVSSSNYNMPLAYFLITVVILLVSLFVMVYNTISNFKSRVVGGDSVQKLSSTYSVLAAWDFGIAEDQAIHTKQKSLHCSLKADLAEQKLDRECANRTLGEKAKLYAIRFLVNFIIIVMLGGAGVAIYYTQAFSSDFTTSSSVTDYHVLVVTVVEFLPSIVIGLLNGIFPLLFEVLCTFEKYRPGFAIRILILRSVFLRLASLAMILISLYVQITCSTQDSCLVGTGTCPAIQCWETYVGSSIYKLLVFDFIIDVAFTLGIELPRKIVMTKFELGGLAKKIGPAVFDIPKNVLDLVYSQSLVWIGFFFSPLLPALGVLRFFVLFYLKLLSALFSTIPPEKPYNASRSSSFFMVILMLTYFLCCIPIGYVLANMSPSPMCGPFSIYTVPSQVIDIQISLAAQWFQTLWDILTSAAVVAALLILLFLALYYCWALNSAHKGLAELMKEQLILEGKDKQFLLKRIAELSGEPKKRPPPMPKPQVNVVNEYQYKDQNGLPQTKDLQNELDVGIEQLLYEGKDKVLVPSPSNDGAPPPSDYRPPAYRPIAPSYTPPPENKALYQTEDTRIVLPTPAFMPQHEPSGKTHAMHRMLPSLRHHEPNKMFPPSKVPDDW